jgi:hypothetical protein
MKTIVPARNPEIAAPVAKTSPGPDGARPTSGSRSKTLGWIGKGALYGAAGMIAWAIALPLGCGSDGGGGSDGSGGSGGSGGATSSSGSPSSSSADSSSSSGGPVGSGGSSGSGGAGGAGGASSSSSSGDVTSSTSTTSSSGIGGGDAGVPCAPNDPGEPNNDQVTAHSIGAVTCSDSEILTQTGTLDGPVDQDWFVYQGTDKITCVVNPAVDVVSASANLQVCMYFFCTQGTAVATCPLGTTADTSSTFQDPGCCSPGTDFTASFDCNGSNNGSATVYLRVDDPSNSAVCTDYSLSLHF